MSLRQGTGAGPWLVNTSIETTDKGGSETVETWEGSYAECYSKRFLLKALGATRLTLAPKGDGNWSVRASFPFDNDDPADTFVDIMELETNAVMRSWAQSAVFRALFSTTAKWQNAVAAIADITNKHNSGLPTINEADSKYYWKKNGTGYATKELALEAELAFRLAAASITSGDATAATNMLYNTMHRKVTSFVEYDQVFRRVITAGDPLQVTTSFTGVGQIWTTAEVTAFEQIPNDGWFTLPAGLQWHKSKPNVLSVFGQKTQLTYHYIEIKTALAVLYEAYSGATLI